VLRHQSVSAGWQVEERRAPQADRSGVREHRRASWRGGDSRRTRAPRRQRRSARQNGRPYGCCVTSASTPCRREAMHPAVVITCTPPRLGGGSWNPRLVPSWPGSGLPCWQHARALAALDIDREPLDRVAERAGSRRYDSWLFSLISSFRSLWTLFCCLYAHAWREKSSSVMAGNGPASPRLWRDLDEVPV